MNTHIAQAAQQLHLGFKHFYQALVGTFQTDYAHMSYQDFANRTARATLPLQSEADAVYFTVCFGWQHFLSFNTLVANSVQFFGAVDTLALNVVDYGCGQGVATLALMEHLSMQKHLKHKQIQLQVHLIEPSAVTLSIAEFLITNMAAVHGIQVNITTQQATLAKAVLANTQKNMKTLAGVETFHLLSNIVDIASVQQQLPQVAQQVQQSQGKHFVLASAPNYSEAQQGFMLLKNQFPASACYFEQELKLKHRSFRVRHPQQWQNRMAKYRMMALYHDNAVKSSCAA